ncbi:MAG: hypothetical protein GYB49_05150 [Alphaproteobacteria bacterium]|nr:hypothetical protein [Alphaproteobacteria bacterium]
MFAFWTTPAVRIARLACSAGLAAIIVSGQAMAESDEALDCGEALSRHVMVSVVEVSETPNRLYALLPLFDAAARKCPENDFAVHYAAAAHVTRALRMMEEEASNDAVMSEWYAAFDYSTAYWKMDEHNDMFEALNGADIVDVEVEEEQAVALRKDLVNGMLEFQAKYGITQPYIIGPDWPKSCHRGLTQDVRIAREWLDANPGGEGLALQFAEALGAACPMAQPTWGLHFELNSIRMAAARAVAESDPPTARAIAAKVEAYRDTVLASEKSRLYWSKDRQTALDEIEAMAANAAP